MSNSNNINIIVIIMIYLMVMIMTTVLQAGGFPAKEKEKTSEIN